MGRSSAPVAIADRRAGAAIAGPPLGRLYAGLMVVLAAVAACVGLMDATTGYSVLLGGLISIGPNSYFARQAFRFRGARAGYLVARSFHWGETGKFVLTAFAFALVFATVKPLDVAALWVAFLGMTAGHWFVWHRQLAGRGKGKR